MSYLYETHLHTNFASACARSKGSEYIKYYKRLGYSGMFVTDHFYNGNTAVPRSLPWKEWVRWFCRGYEEALNEGERQGFDVFFGWEETFDCGDDYLVYGLDKAWLMDHPEAKDWTRGEQFRAVNAAGGCVIQAHPFRQHNYIRAVVLSTGCVNAVEAANATNDEQSYDALALRYAEKNSFPYTAGSDTHSVEQVSNEGTFGVYVEEKLNSVKDFVNVIHNNNISDILISSGRCNYYGNEDIVLPVSVRDRDDRITRENWKNFI